MALTPGQAAAYLARLRAALADPVAFGRVGLGGWGAHEGQAAWLLAPDAREQLLLTGRRWGKSESEAVKTLHRALSRRRKQCVVSITLDQARLIWGEAVSLALNSPLIAPLVAGKPRETPFPKISFVNGSFIEARSVARNGLYLRGHDYDRVVIDEADYVPERVVDEVVRMTLADRDGQLVFTTTPKPRRGLVYKMFKRGQEAEHPGLFTYSGSTFQNPHVSHSYIEAQRARMTKGQWSREVLGLYAGDDDSVFGWDFIQEAYSEWAGPDTYTLPTIEPPQPGRRYVLGADVAKKQDKTVIVVADATRRPYRAVYFDSFNKMPWPALGRKIGLIAKSYKVREADAYVDITGPGQQLEDELKGIATGFTFTNRSKLELLTYLQLALEKGHLSFPFIQQLVDELSGYEWEDDELDTDAVMGLALAVWAVGRGELRKAWGV